MGTSAGQIRHDIERTRQDLGDTIDEVTHRANPKQVARRGTQRVTQRLRGAKEQVMGSAEQAVHQTEGQVKGNPLAAGLIALGAGALAASLLPASKPERQAAQTLSQEAGPAVDRAKQEAKSAGQELGENVKHTAQDAAHHVQEKAKESAQHVKQDATSSAEHVQGQAQNAAKNVEHETRQQM
jgi:ElaB/YqjD/DUF883 family membrane-anchored ribosome-binding protein